MDMANNPIRMLAGYPSLLIQMKIVVLLTKWLPESIQNQKIGMLILILVMMSPRRGWFWGKKLKIGKDAMKGMYKWHGYYITWALIYTFWFHPMDTGIALTFGFFYMFLLLLQGSLFFTRIHTNRWWTLAQEVIVLAHGALVAVMQGNELWRMFAFGFAGIFVITQMHGLGLSRRTRWVILTLYITAALVVYGLYDITNIHQILWIPIIEYLGVLLLAGIFGAGLWMARRIRGRQNMQGEGANA